MRTILQKLLKRWKNFKWYCCFQYGECYLVFANPEWIRLIEVSGIAVQIEPQNNFIDAFKYFKIYNGGLKNEKTKL